MKVFFHIMEFNLQNCIKLKDTGKKIRVKLQ